MVNHPRWQVSMRRRGTAAVEFALVAPLFFLLVLGMVEFGRVIMVEQVLTNAAREGARLAVLDGSTASAVNTAVQTYLTNGGVSGATVTITPTEPSTAGYGQPVTVAVRVPVGNISLLASPFFLSRNRQLSATVVMRRETVQ